MHALHFRFSTLAPVRALDLRSRPACAAKNPAERPVNKMLIVYP